MKRKRIHTTFTKMTVAFVAFGMTPLLLLSILFFARYMNSMQETMISNYSQINRYFAQNVEDVIIPADMAMKRLYEYETESGEGLSVVLKDKKMSDSERAIHVMNALHEVMAQSEYISSERFVDVKGKVYSLYSDQNKTLRNDAGFYSRMSVIEEENMRDLKILRTTEESNICVNSDDFVFVQVRNFMDTSSIKNVYSNPLGTLFVDINVERVDSLVKKLDLNKGSFYVYNPEDNHYIYSQDRKDYMDGRNPLKFARDILKGESGYEKRGDQWVFYQQIATTDEYAVLCLHKSEIIGDFFQTRTMMILILSFSCGILFIFYMMFSNWMSAPTRKLKDAMEQVENGNLDVHVEMNTNDEMEYVADGFNRMTEKLKDYISQVYVAEICQKDAELNALKMQIQPHYLYNTLDVIRMTALEENGDKTAELLECLAHQLRYVMGKHNERITLREELDVLREYFFIMKVRYEDRIMLHVHVANEDMDLIVPKMLLQPVVENAIRHGLREKEGNGTVAITVTRKTEYLEIVVMDDGVGMEEEQVRRMQEVLDYPQPGYVGDGDVSVGMKNVYDRVKLNCGKEYGFTISSVKGMGTIVTYRLPIWEEVTDVQSSDCGR